MSYEIDFLPVGNSNGDAICLRYGNILGGARSDYAIHVIDGGYTDTGQSIVDHLNAFYAPAGYIDHMVLSHADNDHVSGLLTVMKSFRVGHLWMNRPWNYAAETIDAFHGNYTEAGLRAVIRAEYPLLAELEDHALRNGTQIHEAFAGMQIGAFRVLAPTRDRYLELIPQFNRTPESYVTPDKPKGIARYVAEAAKAIVSFFETWGSDQLDEHPPACTPANESSVVQQGTIDGHGVLLTADAGPIALNEAADVAEYLGTMAMPLIVQVPHHGSRRNVTPSVLNRWLGGIVPEGTTMGYAYCSVGSNKPQYPRKRVQNAFLRRGFGVVSTRDGWKRHRSLDLPRRANEQPVAHEPFVPYFQE